MSDDDFVILLDDDTEPSVPDAGERWKVVVIDDDDAVHDGTRFALHDYRLYDRGLEILSAHSAEAGRKLLAEHPDTAVVLLDVVMETDTAGLELIGHIREVLKNDTVRIILRTGQPGQAPERRVIIDYDINDYKAKTELTADKLFTTLTAALRGYDQIRRMDETLRGLEIIVDAASSLFDAHTVEQLTRAVLVKLAELTHGACDGVAVLGSGDAGWDDMAVVAGCGVHDGSDRPASAANLGAEARGLIEAALIDDGLSFGDTGFAVCYRFRSDRDVAFVLETGRRLSETQCALVEVFCSRLGVAFDNVVLYEELQEANTRLEERVAQRTEELNRANAFKKEVLGIVAHDLKNPLSVILGRADMLGQQVTRDPLPVDGIRKQVDQITQSARRMTAMIDGLIKEAMDDALDISIRRHPLDLVRLVHSVAESNRPLSERKSQDLDVVAPQALPIRADYDRLREAIDNLLSNAIKYTPAGGRIRLSADSDGKMATICVADTGPGLSADDMSRLFGRFQRLSAQPTGGESSTGLGLSIVKRIIDLHGGAISAEPTGSDGGTTFRIELPVSE
jgi:signal transduction histidine kinase/DNA-binding NarL/FixJ family response regulator